MAKREDVLEEALQLIRAGVPFEEVMSRYPELAPVLRAARILEGARPPAPSMRAELSSRTAFLQRAEALRASRRQWAGILFGWVRYAPAGAAIAGLMLIFGILHALAQGSLPGDPLYGLKRMEEQVWLALTLDPVERRLVEETLAARRWEEYRTLAQRRGSGTVTWKGRIETIEETTWRIGGVVVEIFPETEILGPAALDQQAMVTAFLGPEGQLIATRIRVISETPTPATSPMPTFGPTPMEAPGASPTRAFRPTPTPSSTVLPMPTTPPPVATPAPSATATPAPTFEKTREPTKTPTPTQTPEENGEETLKWEGILQSISGSTWIIDGRAVQVTAQTEIRGDPRIGDRVEVQARRQPDGTLIAERIERED
ncbi:DUF5666 domain-containing protein [Thermoflexus sp.]|uniref:DUF5666 domain-containing protein n=1 Tax=Thermoflexus sp. TaxID=1969742 RepID=UPI0035E3F8E5